MPSETIPNRDNEFEMFIARFVTVAAAHMAELPLTPEELIELEELSTAFKDAHAQSEAAKNILRGKLTIKDSSRASAERALRPLLKYIQSDPHVNVQLKSDLGLSVTPRVYGPVVAPSGLSASVISGTSIKLSWERLSNSYATSFVIEAKVGLTGEWRTIGVTTKTKHFDTSQKPGEMVFYRVMAQRAGKRSFPSNTAVVNAGIAIDPTLRRAA